MKEGIDPPSGYDFDTTEVASYLGVTVGTLNQWAWQKINLPYVRIGGKRWYLQSDADLYILSRKVKVAPLLQTDAAA